MYSVVAVPVDLSEILKIQCPSAPYKATRYMTVEKFGDFGLPIEGGEGRLWAEQRDAEGRRACGRGDREIVRA